MAGIWESQNKVIPAAYINLVTNTPLSITAGHPSGWRPAW